MGYDHYETNALLGLDPEDPAAGPAYKRHSTASRPSEQHRRRSSRVPIVRTSIVLSERDLGARDDEEQEEISDVNAMFLLFSGAMGAGVLGLPTVFAKNGFIPGAIMIIVGGVFSIISE